MAAALMAFGRIAGISRPALIALIPARKTHPTLLIDMGANADCKPRQLQQFGLMGSIYSEQVYGVPNSRVGLLSIGEEPTKGNELSLAAYALLKEAPLNFVGNIEGRHILTDTVDVVVCTAIPANVSSRQWKALPNSSARFAEDGTARKPTHDARRVAGKTGLSTASARAWTTRSTAAPHWWD